MNCWAHSKNKIDQNGINDFFFTKWIDKNNGWYEGFVGGICNPSTSNGLEFSNDKIKDTINRKRLGLIEFLNECGINLVADWSKARAERITTINQEIIYLYIYLGAKRPQLRRKKNWSIYHGSPTLLLQEIIYNITIQKKDLI
ncbi:hypothetical protein BpHYR1_045193 [Brachionus plicatilis]|uniref:Uncharacterized protein n=1 Tax=Brachionus plicatilis TaxID=10195 RepID=A0A3M7R5W5_BRAPC|nr:hypothetical protein BpHYR1_045193 [Brachionus plicatilis]